MWILNSQSIEIICAISGKMDLGVLGGSLRAQRNTLLIYQYIYNELFIHKYKFLCIIFSSISKSPNLLI